MKACAKCKEIKPVDMFYKDVRSASGFNSYCKMCISEHKTKTRQLVYQSVKPLVFEKRCYKCTEIKCATDFNRESGNKDGLTSICRVCRSLKHKEAMVHGRERYREVAKKANQKRSKQPAAIVHHRVSARIREWLGTKKGGKKTFDLVGYTLPELKQHLERQFIKKMNWENIGEWHIDHIVPLSLFDENQVKQAWAMSNIRPIWAKQNLNKRNKREFLL